MPQNESNHILICRRAVRPADDHRGHRDRKYGIYVTQDPKVMSDCHLLFVYAIQDGCIFVSQQCENSAQNMSKINILKIRGTPR